jgi:hypothetical protein
MAELESNCHFIVRGKTGRGCLGTWNFEHEGSGTRLRWTGQLTMKGFAHLLEPLIGRQIHAQISGQFANLPQLIESEISE